MDVVILVFMSNVAFKQITKKKSRNLQTKHLKSDQKHQRYEKICKKKKLKKFMYRDLNATYRLVGNVLFFYSYI